MKKFTLGILSVLLVFGGVLLSACTPKKVSLSVSMEEVTIYTNDSNAENYKEADVLVDLKNSSSGVYVQVLEGQDSVHVTSATKRSGDTYSFSIVADKSGEARVKVSAVDDVKACQEIAVHVNTMTEKMTTIQGDSVTSRTDLFVVRGMTKDLLEEKYFNFEPVTANIKDVVWAFEDSLGQTLLSGSGEQIARIENGKLFVSENCQLQNITLRASFAYDASVYDKIIFEVLDNSTINSLKMSNFFLGEVDLIENDVVKNAITEFELKRNDATKSKARGTLVVNTKYAVKLTPIVYEKKGSLLTKLDESEWQRLFKFNITNIATDEVSNTITYNFTFDAQDEANVNKFGEFVVHFDVGYRDYAYDISTENLKNAQDEPLQIVLSSKYAVTGVELSNDKGDIINNATVDIFSSYTNGYGYHVKSVLNPTEVEVDNNLFYITLDVEQLPNWADGSRVSDYLQVFVRGVLQEFSPETTGSKIYRSNNNFQNGADVYVSASESISGTISGVSVDFVPVSDPTKETSVTFNLYKVSAGETLLVTGEQGEDLNFFLSSSQSSDRMLTIRAKVEGITSKSGLTLKTDGNSKFVYSSLREVPAEAGGEGDFVVVEFTVSLVGYDFEDTSTFHFEHVTGRVSNNFEIEAFVPLTSATIANANATSSNVYKNVMSPQGFEINEGVLANSGTPNDSLTHLLIEAGSTLPLYVDCQSISDEGVMFKYFSYESFEQNLSSLADFAEFDNDAIAEKAEELFRNDGWMNYVADFYNANFFVDVDNTLLSINENKLILTDNEFKGFICAIFSGYTEEREEYVLVRFFALESFHAVNFLGPNVAEKLLYTTETLSESDMSRSYVIVTISLRADNIVPTYNDLSYFAFKSGSLASGEASGFEESAGGLKNDYYQISNITMASGGKYLRFRITANSTNLQDVFNDNLEISYTDVNGITRRTEIQLEIRNVARIENVTWVNKTQDGEIYLNLNSSNKNERTATISTSVLPAEANDRGLYPLYFPTTGASNYLGVQSNEVGQTFNLTINTTMGGTGYLYLLPKDMIKNVNGVNKILVYKEENEKIVADYIDLSKLDEVYDDLVGTVENDQYLDYFLNNDGDKIYNSNIILKIKITIADGLSEATAIRIYTEAELARIDTAKHYQIMNNLTLKNWDGIDTFKGMIFGQNELITITMAENCGMFVKDNQGTLKDLTFAGSVTSDSLTVGFVAGKNSGNIENVCVDVLSTRESYQSSLLNSTLEDVATGGVSVGGIVGANSGMISNCFTYGLSIGVKLKSGSAYIGGIAGQNEGTVESSGVEFYDFVTGKDGSGNNIVAPNKIKTETINSVYVGGIVGNMTAGKISKSYAYAYPLAKGKTLAGGTTKSDVSYVKVINNGGTSFAGNVGAFVGSVDGTGTVEESFVFLGDVNTPYNNGSLTIKNSYLSYYTGDSTVIMNVGIYNENGTASSVNTFLSENTTYENTNIWRKLYDTSPDIWEVGQFDGDGVWTKGNFDESVNFGFGYLKNAQQNVALDVASLSVRNVDSNGYQKSVAVGSGARKTKGILFLYETTAEIIDSVEKRALENLNTISLADLFGVTANQARTILITTDCKDIQIDGTSIIIKNTNLEGFTLTVHSKMDLTKTQDFEFVIVNNLPTFATTINGVTIKDGQNVLLQKGKAMNVLHSINGVVYLAGNEYATVNTGYGLDFNFVDESGNKLVSIENMAISVAKNGNVLILQGMNSNSTSIIKSFVTLSGLSGEFKTVLDTQRTMTIKVSVYNGATALYIENSSDLSFKPSEYAVIDVVMISDNESDNIVVGLHTAEREIASSSNTETSAVFVVDSKLTIEATWTKFSQVGTESHYRVIVKVKSENRHLIDQNYDGLTLTINALSQRTNSTLEKSVGLSIQKQDIEDIFIQTYAIESRNFKNSKNYYRMSKNIISSLMPGTDAIVAVTVSPAYSLMTHFDITYETVGGTISISRLKYNSNYGFEITPASVTNIANGIRVKLTESDKTGNGVYYFRIYVSTAFTVSDEDSTVSGTGSNVADLKINVNFFNGDNEAGYGSSNLNVDYMPEASVKVGGQSNYLLAKGNSAKVEVTLGIDQELYNLYLQDNGSNIALSSWTKEEKGLYKIYTAYVTAHVDATTKENNGIFYVCADVERVVNGIQEIKTNRATVCLVDFSLDINNIKVKSSGATATYNGKEYDVFYSYVGATYDLEFDYPLLPETYNYDKGSAEEVEAVRALEAKRNSFLDNNNYADENVGYYVNYKFDSTYGTFNALTLKEQLSYATSENESSAIYNGNYGEITQRSNFSIEESENGVGTKLKVTGKKTGTQLMKLSTTVYCQNMEFVKDYYFLIVVDLWSDEDTPTVISSGAEFVDYATNSELADDYILMDDIVLDDYTPLDTDLIKSLDGNGYTIHINSFAMPSGDTLNLALFDTVVEGTTLKNIRVNIYGAGQIDVDVTQYSNINIAGFAIENNGVIYNCEVISYRSEYQNTVHSTNGIVVNYMLGANTDPIPLTDALVDQYGIESNISGFVGTNNASIVNSRVGGESFKQVVEIVGTRYLQSQQLGIFTISGQGSVAGFVGSNIGNVSACFAKNVDIFNNFASTLSTTAGFALENLNSVQNSYVEGLFKTDEENKLIATGTHITSIGYVAGFVYSNSGLVKNSYSNIAVECTNTKPSYASGFVYLNETSGEITLCYSASKVDTTDVNQLPFSGVDAQSNSLNLGTISYSYFYNPTNESQTTQGKLTTGVTAVYNIKSMPEDTLYGFSFSSGEEAYNGIWEATEHGITLVSANRIAVSNRYSVTNGEVVSVFYTKSIVDIDSFKTLDISYGSENNPIIIRSAYDFAVATGKATSKEISSYKEYYNDNEIFGNYRLVNDIDMSEIAQNVVDDNAVKLTTFKKTFSGLLDGNGFTISNINLGSSDATLKSYGLFAKLNGAVIMNADLIVDSIHNAQANVVGTLAGIAVDSRIIAISIEPTNSGEPTVEDDSTSIFGNNIVGGVVGMLFGDSVLYDIKARNIEVYSSYNGTKTVGSNDDEISELRRLVSKDADISEQVATLSYAGAIVGFVDIYNQSNLDDYVKFSSVLSVSDYDVANVRVEGNVSVYGEVTGGIFGYVGNNTYVYNASLKLENPSYIVAKNLYAGGIVGENYGGLFAVQASYTDEVQAEIEKGEHNYYASNTSTERGQLDIFSHKINESDAPLYVGGIAGYMAGGYIYIADSKLNVISLSNKTVAVGGIIGIADYRDTQYQLSFAKNTPTANFLLNEVYASGDLYTNGGFSGGIIGALGKNNEKTPTVAMKNVMAMNYYSYDSTKDGTNLSYDTSTATSDPMIFDAEKHFMLIGKIVADSEVDNLPLTNAIYIINSTNDAYNLALNSDLTGGSIGANTVGGYSKVVLRSGNKIKLNPFGFSLQWSGENPYAKILETEHIGSASLASMASAYVRFNNYFLTNGWSNVYWIHTQDDLFPHIELVPQDNFIYLDAYTKSIETALRTMASNPGITVVVRGKAQELENDKTFSDVDLTGTSVEFDTTLLNRITEFHGTLISFYSYFGDRAGTINVVNPMVSGKGGASGDDPGLIISQSLFNNLRSGAIVDGLNIYFTPTSGDDNIEYSLVSGDTSGAIFRNLNLVLNNNVSLITKTASADGGRKTIVSAGLITHAGYSTSFVDITVTTREVGGQRASVTLSDSSTSSNAQVYMGVLAGYVEQNSEFSSMAIQNIKFKNATGESEEELKVNFNVQNFKNMYVGMYSGAISVYGTTMKTLLSLAKLPDVEMNISTTTDSTETLYAGGYVGMVEGVTQTTLQKVEEDDEDAEYSEKNIVIIENISVTNLYAGLGFGKISSEMNISGLGQTGLKGKVYKGKDATIGHAEIGGIAGEVTSNVNIQSFSTELIVAELDEQEPSYKNGDKTSIFADNEFEYENGLSQFVVGVSQDNAFGGMFGYASGADIKISGTTKVSGTIDVGENLGGSSTGNWVSVGGIIGKSTGNLEINAEINNSMNISVSDESGSTDESKTRNAYVGGIVGWIEEKSGSTGLDIQINQISANSYVSYTGTVLSNVDELKFGGVIGRIKRTSYTTLNISNVVYGGAVKVYGANVNAGGVSAGGVIGESEYNGEVSQPYSNTIKNCQTYGDVFIIYDVADSADYRLATYNFGGIVGKGKYFKVQNCVSIMTSFNSRYSVNGGVSGVYEVGAIVGGDSEANDYEGNKYSSGVNLAYQVEEGNVDCPYGADVAYLGYTSSVEDALEGQNDILKNFSFSKNHIDNLNENVGHKLNPSVLSESVDFAEEELDEDGKLNPAGSFNGIKWIALGMTNYQKESYESGIFENLKNTVFVGNGQKISLTATSDGGVKSVENKQLGGIANTMGSQYSDRSDSEYQTTPSFNVISGLVVEENIIFDINGNGDAPKYGFGGVAGATYGNSIIFGVGVEGEISIGGGNNQLLLGGVVGQMQGGMINECYSDAHLIYRASESGCVSGIANVGAFSNAIKATYSGGYIETYVDVPIYTLACFMGAQSASASATGTASTSTIFRDLIDCYSYAQAKRTMIVSVTTSVYFYNDEANVRSFGQILHGCFDVAGAEDVSDLTIGYDSENIGSCNSVLTDDIGENVTYAFTKWYFNPYTNYGYASHGFGYLKNVSVYTRTKTNAVALGEKENEMGEMVATTVVPEYEYKVVPYTDVLLYANSRAEQYSDAKDEWGNGVKDKWFLGVPNAGKFQQMIDAVKGAYSKQYRFVVEHDINMSHVQSAITFGEDVGAQSISVSSGSTTDGDFVLDGNNHTLNFSKVTTNMKTALFGNVVGDIENLRLIGLNIGGSARGTLAASMTGDLMNVAVVGNLTTKAKTIDDKGTTKTDDDEYVGAVGGIVGTLTGNAKAVEAVVNVTASAGGIVGGVVGQLQEGKISYSSNSGQLIATGADSSKTGLQFIPLGTDGKTPNGSAKGIFNVAVGGIVGYATTGTSIDNSYNANAVLAGYTSTVDLNYLAGGIVGYGDNVTISECYNTGLVGAGNYGTSTSVESKGYSFAGGIFGYAKNMADNSVSSCINDAQVEAIGKMIVDTSNRICVDKDGYIKDEPTYTGWTQTEKNSNGYEGYRQYYEYRYFHKEGFKDIYDISVKFATHHLFGIEGEDDFKYYEISDRYLNEPYAVTYKVTMTYNLGKNRRVYAYGIGFIGKDDTATSSAETTVTTAEETPDEETSTNESKVLKDCYTSEDNIKNDGCVGEIQEYNYMQFKRGEILDNEHGQLDFWGKFTMLADYTVNGYDSYGFPVRLFKTDTIERLYGAEVTNNEKTDMAGFVVGDQKFTNDIFRAYRTTTYKVQSDNWAWTDNRYWHNYEGKWTMYDGHLCLVSDAVYYDSVTFKYFADSINSPDYAEIFGLKQETEYYSSVEFTPYDKLLKGIGTTNETYDFGLVAFDSNKRESISNTEEDAGNATENSAEADINKKINEIDVKTELEQGLTEVTINGESSAIVHSAKNFISVYAPVVYKGTATINVGTMVNASEIMNKNFSVSNSEEAVQTYTIDNVETWEDDATLGGGNVKVAFTAYMAKETTNQFTVTFSYNGSGTFKITGDNVRVETEGTGSSQKTYTYIYLHDGTEAVVSEDIISAIKSGNSIDNTTYTFESAGIGYDSESGTYSVENSWYAKTGDGSANYSGNITIDWDETLKCGYMKLNGDLSANLPNDATFWFVYKKTETNESNATLLVNTEKITSAYTVEKTTTATFIGYENGDFTGLGINYGSFSDASTSGGQFVITLDLSAIENASNGKIAFGDDTFGFNYTRANGWKIVSYSTTESIWQEVETLTTSVTLDDGSTEDVTISIDTTSTPHVLEATSSSEEAVVKAKSMLETYFANANVYRNKNSEDIEYFGNSDPFATQTVRDEIGGFEYKAIYNFVNNGNFYTKEEVEIVEGTGEIYHGFYRGNDFDGESGGGIEIDEKKSSSIFGLDFYAKKVTYGSTANLTIKNKVDYVAYDFTTTGLSPNVSESGVIKDDWTKEFENLQAGATFTISYIETSLTINEINNGRINEILSGNLTYTTGEGDPNIYQFSSYNEYDEFQAYLNSGRNLSISGDLDGVLYTEGVEETGTADEYYTYYQTLYNGKWFRYYDQSGVLSVATGLDEYGSPTSSSKRYVKKGDTIYEIYVKEAVRTAGDGETTYTYYVWDYGTDGVKTVDASSNTTVVDLFDETNYDVLIRYFDDTHIAFARNEYSKDGETVGVAGSVSASVTEIKETLTATDFDLIKVSDSYDVSIPGEWTFSYESDEISGEIEDDSEDKTVTESRIGEHEYSYIFEMTLEHEVEIASEGTTVAEIGENGAVKESEAEVKDFKNIILSDDVHMWDNLSGKGDADLIADGYIVKYIAKNSTAGETISLFTSASGSVSDLTIVGITSMDAQISGTTPTATTYSMLEKESKTTDEHGTKTTTTVAYTNVAVYGSIRNVNAGRNVTVSPYAGTSDVTSYVTIVGADGADGESSGDYGETVNVTLQDQDKTATTQTSTQSGESAINNYESHSILIAGNGGNGANGANGEKTDSDSGRNGKTGGSGGTGGSVTYSGSGFVRAGIAGIGGYGGNGANGYFYEVQGTWRMWYSKALGGGKPGVGGTYSSNGTVVTTTTDKVLSQRTVSQGLEKKVVTTQTDAQTGETTYTETVEENVYTAYYGNGGIGGFGRIVYKEKLLGSFILKIPYLYTSGKANGQGNGSTATNWKISDNYTRENQRKLEVITFSETSKLFKFDDWKYGEYDTNWPNEQWHPKVQGKIAGTSTSSYGGTGDVYVSIRLRDYLTGYRDNGDCNFVAWESGEKLNWGGYFWTHAAKTYYEKTMSFTNIDYKEKAYITYAGNAYDPQRRFSPNGWISQTIKESKTITSTLSKGNGDLLLEPDTTTTPNGSRTIAYRYTYMVNGSYIGEDITRATTLCAVLVKEGETLPPFLTYEEGQNNMITFEPNKEPYKASSATG